MTCLKRGCQDCVRNGIVHNRQRYRCKACGYNYTSTKPRGYPKHMKQQALQLYLEGMGFRAIGRVLEISNVTVLNWIRAYGEAAAASYKETRPDIAMIDEMWHFVHTKKTALAVGLVMFPHRTDHRRSLWRQGCGGFE